MVNVEIRHLKTFLTVARLLSFNKAAQRLNYAQSSVSAQIQALEEELGVRLFDRLGRRIVLTEAGQGLVQYAEKIIDLAAETLAEIGETDQPRGSLTIRIPETFGVYRLPPVIKEFKQRFPHVRLNFTVCAHEGLSQDLRKGVTDLAFLITETFSDADMEAEVLGFENLALVASPSHHLAKLSVVRPGDLTGELVLLSRVDCSYRRIFEHICEQEGVAIDASLVFHSVETLKRCVATGLGITILPEVAVAEEIEAGRLARLEWEVGPLEVAVLMLWYRERWLSPTLSAFMEIARKILKEGPYSA